jgi:hypothetical protein
MCLKIRCDEKSEKFYKIFWELNLTKVDHLAISSDSILTCDEQGTTLRGPPSLVLVLQAQAAAAQPCCELLIGCVNPGACRDVRTRRARRITGHLLVVLCFAPLQAPAMNGNGCNTTTRC